MRQYINLFLCEEAIASPHGVEGLPDNIKFHERQLQQAIERGGRNVFRAVAAPHPDKPDSYNVHLHPANPGNAIAYQQRAHRPNVSYYDPALADLETHDQGEEYIERTFAHAKPHLSTECEGLPDKDVIYRGMAKEEYDQFLRTGEIKSKGEYNLGGQEELTYWTTDVRSAQSYANGFAPLQWKPTIGHPCFILAATMPDHSDTQRVAGTGEHEIGVKRAIGKNEIRAVWEGRVYNHDGETYELRPLTYGDHTDAYLSGRTIPDDETHKARYGGYSAQVVWMRIQ